MSGPVRVETTFGVRCLSNRAPAIKIDGDSGGAEYRGGFSLVGASAALPYFGAAIGLLLGELVVWLLQAA